MPARRIDAETREFVREMFEWIKTSGVELGYFRADWKNHLIDIIAEEMRKEGRVIKRESIRRNLNRMISYYYDTGAQARSGRVYLRYLQRHFDRICSDLCSVGAVVAQYFLSAAEARLYRGELRVLIDVPDFARKAIVVYRLPVSP